MKNALKKIINILFIFMLCIGVSACGGETEKKNLETVDDVEKIVNENNFVDNGFDDVGLFWKFSFYDMEFSVGFNIEEKPKNYFLDNTLSASDVSFITVYPNKGTGYEWIYLRVYDNKFAVDEDDLEKFNDMGREEAYEAYQEKFGELGLSAELFGKWVVNQFNKKTRVDMISNAQKEANEVLEKLKEGGYNYEKDSQGRQIISSGDRYKIVIANKQCMVMDAEFDLNVKTGYMYVPAQGTVGYIINGETQFIYQYSDNTIIQGTPTLSQYAECKELKNWYDDLLTTFSTSTEVLQRMN